MSLTEVKKSPRLLLSSAAVVACVLLACLAARAQEEDKPAAKKPAAAANTKTAPAQKKKKTTTTTTPAPAEATNAKAAPAKTQAEKAAAADGAAGAQEGPGKAAKSRPSGRQGADAPAASKLTEEEAKARLAEIQKLPAWERITELEYLLDSELPDAAELRAIEQLVSALAAHGDERLQQGDAARGVELFRQAVRESPEDMTDKLFFDVVSQFPANLYLRGQQAAAFDLAGRIERRAKDNPRRLVALAPFYLSVERSGEAARLAGAAIKLAPDLPAAHQALAAAHRQSLRLDEAATSYARALELDPKSAGARRSLADLRRGAGRTDEALALYRELLAADAKDAAARSGVVLSLFDAGKREEAERELDSALKDDPKNLPLLAGAAYWYAARGERERALDFAARAVRVEPRYPWAQVALARALVAANRPLEAERALRFTRMHARFPSLDYELASALAAAGLFDEAAETLAQSFTLKDGRIETKLAGRVAAGGGSFTELLAPERRASFFQPNAAETIENARRMKALFTLHQTLRAGWAAGAKVKPDDGVIGATASEFAAGDDEMRAFRELYAADWLVRRGVASKTAFELTEAARKSLAAGLASPHAPVAALAEDLHEIRERAIARGGTPSVPDIPADILANLVRGRVEDLSGRALFNLGRNEEAVAAFRRAVSVLPETSPQWRAAQWHLGLALAGAGDQASALAAYIKSYDPRAPDPARLALIESLYRKLNGSVAGLGRALSRPAASPAFERASGTGGATTATQADPTTPAQTEPAAAADAKKIEAETKRVEPASVAPTATPTPAATPEAAPEVKQPAAESATPQPSPTPDELKKVEGEKAGEKEKEKAEAAPATAETKPQTPSRGARRAGASASSPCALVLADESLSLASGASSVIVVRLEGEGDLARTTATTPNWSDIIVLREPTSASEPDTARFTITSISKTAGTYTVTIKSPCGAKDVAVTVK